MLKRNYTVYKHTCPNTKIYIGITRLKPETRWENGNGYSHNKHFTNAIEKYGWDNIKHEIIASSLTQEEACKLEIDLIEAYQSMDRDFGYNNSPGGETGDPVSYGYLPTYEEIKRDKELKELFDAFIKEAKGYTYKEVTNIYEIDNNGLEKLIDTKINEIKVKPNKKVIKTILMNYLNEEELKDLINELTDGSDL